MDGSLLNSFLSIKSLYCIFNDSCFLAFFSLVASMQRNEEYMKAGSDEQQKLQAGVHRTLRSCLTQFKAHLFAK
jgi:hypothetical protein